MENIIIHIIANKKPPDFILEVEMEKYDDLDNCFGDILDLTAFYINGLVYDKNKDLPLALKMFKKFCEVVNKLSSERQEIDDHWDDILYSRLGNDTKPDMESILKHAMVYYTEQTEKRRNRKVYIYGEPYDFTDDEDTSEKNKKDEAAKKDGDDKKSINTGADEEDYCDKDDDFGSDKSVEEPGLEESLENDGTVSTGNFDDESFCNSSDIFINSSNSFEKVDNSDNSEVNDDEFVSKEFSSADENLDEKEDNNIRDDWTNGLSRSNSGSDYEDTDRSSQGNGEEVISDAVEEKVEIGSEPEEHFSADEHKKSDNFNIPITSNNEPKDHCNDAPEIVQNSDIKPTKLNTEQISTCTGKNIPIHEENENDFCTCESLPNDGSATNDGVNTFKVLEDKDNDDNSDDKPAIPPYIAFQEDGRPFYIPGYVDKLVRNSRPKYELSIDFDEFLYGYGEELEDLCIISEIVEEKPEEPYCPCYHQSNNIDIFLKYNRGLFLSLSNKYSFLDQRLVEIYLSVVNSGLLSNEDFRYIIKIKRSISFKFFDWSDETFIFNLIMYLYADSIERIYCIMMDIKENSKEVNNKDVSFGNAKTSKKCTILNIIDVFYNKRKKDFDYEYLELVAGIGKQYNKDNFVRIIDSDLVIDQNLRQFKVRNLNSKPNMMPEGYIPKERDIKLVSILRPDLSFIEYTELIIEAFGSDGWESEETKDEYSSDFELLEGESYTTSDMLGSKYTFSSEPEKEKKIDDKSGDGKDFGYIFISAKNDPKKDICDKCHKPRKLVDEAVKDMGVVDREEGGDKEKAAAEKNEEGSLKQNVKYKKVITHNAEDRVKKYGAAIAKFQKEKEAKNREIKNKKQVDDEKIGDGQNPDVFNKNKNNGKSDKNIREEPKD